MTNCHRVGQTKKSSKRRVLHLHCSLLLQCGESRIKRIDRFQSEKTLALIHFSNKNKPLCLKEENFILPPEVLLTFACKRKNNVVRGVGRQHIKKKNFPAGPLVSAYLSPVGCPAGCQARGWAYLINAVWIWKRGAKLMNEGKQVEVWVFVRGRTLQPVKLSFVCMST